MLPSAESVRRYLKEEKIFCGFNKGKILLILIKKNIEMIADVWWVIAVFFMQSGKISYYTIRLKSSINI